MEDKQDNFQLEEAFKEVEFIISRLESNEISLKEALDLYGKGAKLMNDCKNELTGIEKQIQIIGENLD